MTTVATLDTLLATRTLWHAGRNPGIATDGEPTGHEALDALLPQGGWPRRALTELLLPADGIGELALLLPTLARCTQAGAEVAVIAPPYLPYAPAWQAAGVDLSRLQVIEATPRDALWAFEQCLRSGACEVVMGWPLQADARALRRLQVAADSGHCLGFAMRDRKHAANPSPAPLRLEAVRDAQQGMTWRVRKCRGGAVPSQAFVRCGSSVPPSASGTFLRERGKGREAGVAVVGSVHFSGHADASGNRHVSEIVHMSGARHVSDIVHVSGAKHVSDIVHVSATKHVSGTAHAFALAPSPARGGGLGWGQAKKANTQKKRNGTLELRFVDGAAPLPRG